MFEGYVGGVEAEVVKILYYKNRKRSPYIKNQPEVFTREPLNIVFGSDLHME